MAFMVQIADEMYDLTVTMTIPGKYNPDALDDMKRRAVDAYREALSSRAGIELAIQKEVGGDEEA